MKIVIQEQNRYPDLSVVASDPAGLRSASDVTVELSEQDFADARKIQQDYQALQQRLAKLGGFDL